MQQNTGDESRTNYKTEKQTDEKKHEEITEEKIDAMIRDVRRYLANRQDRYEINQQYLGMKLMF